MNSGESKRQCQRGSGGAVLQGEHESGCAGHKNKRRQSHPHNVVQSFRGLIGFQQEGRKYDENPRHEIEEGYYDRGKSKGHTTNFTE